MPMYRVWYKTEADLYSTLVYAPDESVAASTLTEEFGPVDITGIVPQDMRVIIARDYA